MSHRYRVCVWSMLMGAALTPGARGQNDAAQPPGAQPPAAVPLQERPRGEMRSAQPPPATPSPNMTFLPSQGAIPPQNNGPLTMRLDPCTGFPPEGPPISLFSPFAVYARSGAALNTGRGPLSDILRTGVGVDGGVRSFLFDMDHAAAWYGDLGLSYLYNDSRDAGQSIITSHQPVAVSRLGQTVGLAATTELGVRELHRTNTRLTFGREYYFGSNWFPGMKASIGGDFGGVWGWASVKTQINSQTLTGSQPGDVVQGNSLFNHHGDQVKGFFVGSSMNLILPRDNYDFIVGTRVEWERDYFKLANNDDGVSQLKLFLEIGWRF